MPRMDASSFADIEQEFRKRTDRIVWCTVTTIDSKGRPRSRILHPVWDGSTGWIATGRNSLKAAHLAGNPFVSCSYWDPQHEQVYADCRASWADDPAVKARVWELVKNAPPPVGYDPAIFWPGGAASPEFGALKLEPWRIELSALDDLRTGTKPKVWRS